MKKTILITLFAFVAMLCQAQFSTPTQMTGIRGILGDTITNTGTAYDSVLINGPYPAASVVATIKKISGTVSPTLLLQASADGIHWVTFGQDTDVISNSTGTVSFTWQLPGLPMKSRTVNSTVYTLNPQVLPFLYYRVFATGTGTMAAILKSWIAIR